MPAKVKVAIVGTGAIARDCHIPAYQSLPDRCEVVAACDVDPEALASVAQRFGITRTTTDYRELVADPDIDAVSVTTPNAYHKQPTVDFLLAGKHVLCEKPLAMNAREAAEMCDAARRSGKILQVALQQRFAAPTVFVKHYIDAGHMGEIYYARAQALRRRGVPHWGSFIDREKQGGGPLIDIGVHVLDMTLYFMGYPRPVAASGLTWDKLGKNPDLANFWGEYDRERFTVEDFAVALIRLENGAAITLETSFMAHMEGDPFQTQLFGTKSGAIVKGWGDDPVRIFTEFDRQMFALQPMHIPRVPSAHTAEVVAFIDAIQHGKPSPVPGEHGLVLNAIFDAVYRSAETGREEPVQLPD